ncbi:MAG TPA: S-formylglutathione hydrolase [Geminicoccaceae bacterium]|nr:S-formylglutathione hydrolase [Geminicoccaceae bacterium]
MTSELVKQHRCYGGTQCVYRHESSATQGAMEIAVYLPPQAERGEVPVLYWLSGLTCTWANFTEKAGAQRLAAEHGLMIVAPDTSPRGTDFPGEHDAYDFGSGAGFYVDATQEPWSRNYRMYTYVTQELPALIEARLPVDRERRGIFGHSMGGHGALICALKNPERYRSLSAFAPIAAPMRCPWGEKAFRGYLGDDRETWRAWDATELAAGSGWQSEVLVDQGTADDFLDEQLKPELLQEAFRAAAIPLTLRYQAGYDHSYYFMASFIADHFAHHARLLKA